MLECLIHEPLAREIGQPLLTLLSLNKINLIINLIYTWSERRPSLTEGWLFDIKM